MLAQLFCQSDDTARQMIVGAQNAVNDRLATAMDPIDFVIEAIKMDTLPIEVEMELKSTEVGALLSVAMSHSGTFTRVSERMYFTPGMELLLRRLAQVTPSKNGYTIEDWLTAAVHGRAPGEEQHYQRAYGASKALRTAMLGALDSVAAA